MNIKELDKQILGLEYEEFENFINEIYTLKYGNKHVYNSTQNKDGGADGYSKVGEYILACYAPKNDKKLDNIKIYIDIIKHIKWIHEKNYKISKMYIKSSTIARNNAGYPFDSTEFKIKSPRANHYFSIITNEFIDKHIKLFENKKMPNEIIDYYIEHDLIIKKPDNTYKRKKNLPRISFEYYFIENIRNQWIETFNDDTIDYNLKYSIFSNYLKLDDVIEENRNKEIETLSQQIKRKFNDEIGRLDLECSYTQFLKKNYKLPDQMIYISDYIHLESLQEKKGTYLGYKSSLQEAIEDIKGRKKLYGKSLSTREVFEHLYVEEGIIKIDKNTNQQIHKGVCGHIGSDSSVIYKENDGINWDK